MGRIFARLLTTTVFAPALQRPSSKCSIDEAINEKQIEFYIYRQEIIIDQKRLKHNIGARDAWSRFKLNEEFNFKIAYT